MKNSKGQIVLIVVLVSTVVLTIGLAVAGRITTDLKIASQTSSASQAMLAAEAGVDYALTLPNMSGDCSISEVNFNSLAKTDCTIRFILPAKDVDFDLGNLNTGESKTIWLVSHDVNRNLDFSYKYIGKLKINWVPDTARVEIAVIYDASGAGDYAISRYLETGEITLDSATFAAGGGNWVAIRVKPVSANISLSMTPQNSGMPSQGIEVDSLGTFLADDVSQRVILRHFYHSLPAAFDYVILSNQKIIK